MKLKLLTSLSADAILTVIRNYTIIHTNQSIVFTEADVRSAFYLKATTDTETVHLLIRKMLLKNKIIMLAPTQYCITGVAKDEIKNAVLTRRQNAQRKRSLEAKRDAWYIEMVKLTQSRKDHIITLKEVHVRIMPTHTIQFVHTVLNEFLDKGLLTRAKTKEGYIRKGKYVVTSTQYIDVFDNAFDDTLVDESEA